MRLETATQAVIEIGRIPRSIIDDYIVANPAPEPPTIKVEVFGGGTELVDDREAPEYLSAVMQYNLHMAREEFAMIAKAVTLVEPEDWQLDPKVAELATLGIVVSEIVDYLRYIALGEDDDLAFVIGEVLYLSTVTQRGIEEAERAFNILYRGVPLSKHPNPGSDFHISAYYQARLAAHELGYTWVEFSALSGPEQSALMAQYQCQSKVQWLVDREQEQKIRQQSQAAKGRSRR